MIDVLQLLLLAVIAGVVVYGELSAVRYRNRALPLYQDRLGASVATWARVAGRNPVVAALRDEEQANGHREHEELSHDLMVQVGSDR